MADRKDHEQEEQPRILISDMRHSRDEDAAEETPEPESAAEAPAEPELSVVEPEEAPEETPVAAADAPADDAPVEHSAPPGVAGEPAAEEMPQTPEMEQLKMIFDAGISAYLAGQVSMVINFALIYLGRAANPATGLVATDPKKAKVAIDTLEFISGQIKDELPPAEQQQLTGIVADLKFNYMQSVAGGVAPAPPKDGDS